MSHKAVTLSVGRPGNPVIHMDSGAYNPAEGDQAVPAGHFRRPEPSPRRALDASNSDSPT